MRADALQQRFRGENGRRRAGRQRGGEVVKVGVESIIGDDSRQAEGAGFVRVHQTRREDQFRRTSDTHGVDQSREVCCRQTITQRAGHGNAKPRTRRAHAQVTRQRDGTAAANRCAIDGGDADARQPLDPVDHRVQPLFICNTIVTSTERGELRDVRPSGECAAAAADDEDAKIRCGVDAIAGIDDGVVHIPGQRVLRLRTIERQCRDGPIDGPDHVA